MRDQELVRRGGNSRARKPFAPRLLALAVAGALVQPALADDLLELEEVMVTASPRPVSKMESSTSVSSMNTDDLANYAPRSTAEAFRNIPGIRAEASGGEGNANIAVRGLPVASGGAKFLQLQEDGLPVMQFGDIAFGNADIFLRLDSTVGRVESIRGGSASTFASNSPGGVINVISRTGEEAMGSASATVGLDYDSVRTDFEYGGPLADGWRYHVGGFYREGDGPRDAGYTGNSGGQIKANLTREFDNGYARVYFKHLDDKAVSYMPMPARAGGGSITGYDILGDTLQTPLLKTNLGIGDDGNTRRSDITDGMHPVYTSVGTELSFDLGDSWTVTDRFRKAFVDGGFNTPFPAEIGDAQGIAESIGGAGASLVYANGSQAGTAIADPSALNGNGLAMRMHLFDVEYNDLGSYTNDLKVSKDFDSATLTFGYYAASQSIDMSWLWNSYLMEVKGDEAALLDVVNADGESQTDGGLLAYGVPFWGNCCTRNYDAEYDIRAPYVSLEWLLGDLTLDASLRHDSGSASGSYAGNLQMNDVDVNGDGTISVPEQSVSFVDNANALPIDYDWSYTSYSLGANYLLTEDLAVFGRLSHGGRANADRLLFGPNVLPDGGLRDDEAAVDEVDQVETGVKYRRDNLGLFATAFYAETEEQNFEATTQTFFDRDYKAQGVEFEGSYQMGDFNLAGSVTWTDAEIAGDKLNPSLEGNIPRRQADWIYALTPSYTTDRYSVGVNIIGTSDAYAQDNNDLKFDAYTQANLFANYFITPALSVGLNVNNLFDEEGLTEAEEGSVTENGIIRARSINGRTSSVTFKYEF
ncbi:TonB-dependent siderophore receptor [Microbulbifer sp.]|uniref:TonB-dependent siderophore receptor n=1 Tax=Microbulbifer sp. TaxID=1908541 RepID=UPI003F2D984C